MLRRTGKEGAILTLTIPIEASGFFSSRTANVRLSVLIEKVENGQVTLLVEEPRIEDES